MARKFVTKKQSRAAFLSRDLEVDIDSEGQIDIKTRPMFERELRKMLREVKDEARKIVAVEHSHPPRRDPRMTRGEDPRKSGNTGRMLSSIQVGGIKKVHAHRISGSVTAGSSRAPYTRYVHEGTRQHGQGRYMIKARNSPVLSFVNSRGRFYLIPQLHQRGLHPGIKRPSKFLNRAATRVVVTKYAGRVKTPSRR